MWRAGNASYVPPTLTGAWRMWLASSSDQIDVETRELRNSIRGMGPDASVRTYGLYSRSDDPGRRFYKQEGARAVEDLIVLGQVEEEGVVFLDYSAVDGDRQPSVGSDLNGDIGARIHTIAARVEEFLEGLDPIVQSKGGVA